MSNKKSQASLVDLLAHHSGVLRCPLCFGPMHTVESRSIVCGSRHCFDISKLGYVNLLNRTMQSKYDKRLFDSRRRIAESGFFEPLSQALVECIRGSHSPVHPLAILDAGCGEGSLLSGIRMKLERDLCHPPLAVGIDLSKEGISRAAAEYKGAMWFVADIANCPFAARQFHFVLNVLSPANYTEFQRIAAAGGTVLKVIPGSEYLKELRDLLYDGSARKTYSNDHTLAQFQKYFVLSEVRQIRYHVNLDPQLLDSLVDMTPLSWGVTEQQRQKALQLCGTAITVDFVVLLGKSS
ncbi:putative RNA methyltransferase [Paenibacillus silviterrae]|uniref:putative RNA methyltransferase n=1 Tax=Paenibacillus silviterrae TaxID=3242194 RepID=UPI002542C8A2|nr:methyltransferase domain-containing protein [Paenibacillus chinjuensis]